jgi:KTSC domain
VGAAMARLRTVVVGCALVAASGAALAERVYVKARGEVDLAPFQCETIPARNSPNVRRICYDANREYVLVSLSGVWYHYCGVPPATVSEWRRSVSKGRYYNDHIRNGFDCVPAEGAAAPSAAPAPAPGAR